MLQSISINKVAHVLSSGSGLIVQGDGAGGSFYNDDEGCLQLYVGLRCFLLCDALCCLNAMLDVMLLPWTVHSFVENIQKINYSR